MKKDYNIEEILEAVDVLLLSKNKNEKLKSKQNYEKILPNTEKIILQAEDYIKNS